MNKETKFLLDTLKEELETKKKSLTDSMEYVKNDFERQMDSITFERNMISDLVVQTQSKTEIKTLEHVITKIELMFREQ